ncbi:MAG: PilZ domain-containing protein [Myxococcota bacterium]
MGRRSHYRVKVDTVDPVQITLAVRGWPPIGVRLRDANAHGIAVDVDPDLPVPTSPGNQVELTVWLVMRHRAVVVPAKIVTETTHEHGRRLGLHFVDPDSVDRELACELGVVFNRRGGPRHAIREFSPVSLVPVGAPGPAVIATACDVSSCGVGVTMAPMDDSRLSGATHFRAQIELDEAGGVIDTRVELRHRRLSGGRVTYGLRFDPEESDGLAAIRTAIQTFIETRAAAPA